MFAKELNLISRALDESPPLKLKNPTAIEAETKATVGINDIVARVNEILNTTNEDWRTMFIPLVTVLGTETIAQVEADFGIAFDVKNPFIPQFAAGYVPIFADRITSSTRNALVNDLIMAGYEQGLGIPELARLIEGKYDQWDKTRATTIARTETGRVANAATFNGLRDIGITRKEWLATNDPRTRAEHWKAHHQIVDMDDPFIVGGEKLMYPNDINGTAKQTINCRCTLAPVMDDMFELLPMPEPEQRLQAYKPLVSNGIIDSVVKHGINVGAGLINNVHAIGIPDEKREWDNTVYGMTERPLPINATAPSGYYNPNRQGAQLPHIVVSDYASELDEHYRRIDSQFTLIHETGHLIDKHLFSVDNNYGSHNADKNEASPLHGIMRKIKETTLYAEIKKISETATVEVVYTKENGFLGIKKVADEGTRKYYEYLARDIELFARAYTQYIAFESGTTARSEFLGEYLEVLCAGSKYGWNPSEFRDIQDEFNKLFKELGWKKP